MLSHMEIYLTLLLDMQTASHFVACMPLLRRLQACGRGVNVHDPALHFPDRLRMCRVMLITAVQGCVKR